MYDHLSSDPNKRASKVRSFNTNVLKHLSYYGGYTTTQLVRIRTKYSAAGCLKRLNKMVEIGWLHKIETNQLLGGNTKFWALTKAGALAARDLNDDQIENNELYAVNASDIAPSMINHTAHTQLVAAKLKYIFEDNSSNVSELRPKKFFTKHIKGRKREYYVPDILYYNYTTPSNFDVGFSFEVELTPKTVARYQRIFERIESANECVRFSESSPLYIRNVCYVCPDNIYNRLLRILSNVTVKNIYVTLVPILQLQISNIIDEKNNVVKQH
jgi:hypothetical protein